MNRRQTMIQLASLAALTAAPKTWAQGSDFPARPIRIVVPFTPGSPPDIITRAIAPKMSDGLGQPVIVENKPGATTTIGSEFVARAPADGYTLLMTATGAPSVFPAIMKLRYDAIKDLPPLGMIVTSQQVFFSGGPKRVNNLKELVERARQNPAKPIWARSALAPPTTWRWSCLKRPPASVPPMCRIPRHRPVCRR